MEFLCGLQDRGEYTLWTGAMQRAEVVFFMRPEEEAATRLFLIQFKTAPGSAETVDRAGSLYRKWHPSHGIDVNDALLAATALETGGRIFCLNVRHYPMPGILVERAW